MPKTKENEKDVNEKDVNEKNNIIEKATLNLLHEAFGLPSVGELNKQLRKNNLLPENRGGNKK